MRAARVVDTGPKAGKGGKGAKGGGSSYQPPAVD